MKNSRILIIFLLSIWGSKGIYAQQQGFGCIKNKSVISFTGDEKANPKNVKPIVNTLPIFGNKSTKSDKELPLPFGTGIYTLYYNQGYTASNLKLTTDSSLITAKADTIYQSTTAYEYKVQFRPNFWIFPFLNVYGIIGYTKGVISPDMVVPGIIVENVPIFDSIVIDSSFEIHDEIGYVGPTYGFGATFSMGFHSFFVLVDYNYSITNPTDLDDNLHNHFFSPKIGILLGKATKKSYGAFWIGGMYISNDQSFTGEINVADINPDLILLLGEKATYSGKISAKQQWNFLFGGSWIINNRHHLVVEAGFFSRKQISFGYDFRF